MAVLPAEQALTLPVHSRPRSPWDRTWGEWGGPRSAAAPPPRFLTRLRRVLLRWPVLFTLVILVAAGLAVDLVRPATAAGRLSDLQGYYTSAQTDMASCSGGLRDSLTVLTAVLSGTSSDRKTAESVAVAGAQACSPASNGNFFDFATTAPPNSLSRYGVTQANKDLSAWAYPGAALAEAQIYRLIKSGQGPGSPKAVALYNELTKLSKDGARAQAAFDQAARRLGGGLAPLYPSVSPAVPKVLLHR